VNPYPISNSDFVTLAEDNHLSEPAVNKESNSNSALPVKFVIA